MTPAFDAAVFDLDGVVTFTARIHAAAWKQVFDEFLGARARATGSAFQPFTDDEYRAYVDGRPRRDGIRTFLAARKIGLPEGTMELAPNVWTIEGIARRKDEAFRRRLRQNGVPVDRDAVEFIRSLRAHDIAIGAASSSRNARLVLHVGGIADLFDACTDGITIDRLGLPGKPAPDLFLACLEQLGIRDPGRAFVAEDAQAGVEAGRRARFGLVLGVDRGGNAKALYEHGADLVIESFRGLSFERIDAWFRKRHREHCA